MPSPARKRPPIVFVWVAAALLSVAGITFGSTWFGVRAYAVAVSGVEIGYVTQASLVDEVVQELMAEASARVGREVQASEVRVSRVRVKGAATPLGKDDLRQLLGEALPLTVSGALIRINGQDVVGVADRQTAQDLIDGIREEYIARFNQPGTSFQEVGYDDEIEILDQPFPVALFRDPATAKTLLMRGTDKIVAYQVKKGDSLWTIATRNDLTVEALTKANPEIDPNRLQIGQQVNLVAAEPFLHLATRERRTYTVSIPYPVKTVEDPNRYVWADPIVQVAGVSGKKEIVEEILRLNGKVVSRTVISQKVLSEPTGAVLLRGTKNAPPLGSGQYVWPIPSTDWRITTGFERRWGRMHWGLDIAAKLNTNVLAADSGTVTFVGWKGDFGKTVIVDHGNGKTTLYAHLNGWAVSVGQEVKKGQVIAYVGNTGRSTGPHLHFETRTDDKPHNPWMLYAKN